MRHPKELEVQLPHSKKVEKFKLLGINEFNSDRKRMSVVVRAPDKKIYLYCKGADSILEKLLVPNQRHFEKTWEHLAVPFFLHSYSYCNSLVMLFLFVPAFVLRIFLYLLNPIHWRKLNFYQDKHHHSAQALFITCFCRHLRMRVCAHWFLLIVKSPKMSINPGDIDTKKHPWNLERKEMKLYALNPNIPTFSAWLKFAERG